MKLRLVSGPLLLGLILALVSACQEPGTTRSPPAPSPRPTCPSAPDRLIFM